MSLYNLWNRIELYAMLLGIAAATVGGVWKTIDPLGYAEFVNSTILYVRGAPSSMIDFDYTAIAMALVAIPPLFYVYLRLWNSLIGKHLRTRRPRH